MDQLPVEVVPRQALGDDVGVDAVVWRRAAGDVSQRGDAVAEVDGCEDAAFPQRRRQIDSDAQRNPPEPGHIRPSSRSNRLDLSGSGYGPGKWRPRSVDSPANSIGDGPCESWFSVVTDIWVGRRRFTC